MAVSDYIVAAICGCWYRESHVNPAIWESLVVCDWDYVYEYTNKGGYGFGQWTNTSASGTGFRLGNMYDWMTANGYAMTSGTGELEYMVNQEKWWVLNDTTYPNLQGFLASTSTDTNELVRIFLANWEGVPGNALSERQGHAARFLRYIQQNKTKTGWQWYYGNTYDLGGGYTTLSASGFASETYSNRSLSNVMMVWQYFNGYIPDEPEKPDPDEPAPEGYHKVTVNVTGGNGTAFARPFNVQAGGTVKLYYYDSTEYRFTSWTVVEGDITIKNNSFTMPDADVIINAVFEGYTPDSPDPTPAPSVKRKSKWWLAMRPTWTWEQLMR